MGPDVDDFQLSLVDEDAMVIITEVLNEIPNDEDMNTPKKWCT